MKKFNFGFSAIALVAVLVLAIGFSGCQYAQANVQTLVTHDCGVSWELIKAGQAVPRGTGNYCFRAVTIPDYPMQGDAKFRSNFKGNVKADVDLSYSYRIIDGIKFISEAKYIGNNTNSEDAKANDTRFEGAENSVIDRHIRDIQRELLVNEDIVDFDAAAFEVQLLAPVNERLKERGVEIEYLSFVPNPDVLTGDAIDAATALRIFRNNGIPDNEAYGFIRAKLGAAQIGKQPEESSAPKPEQK